MRRWNRPGYLVIVASALAAALPVADVRAVTIGYSELVQFETHDQPFSLGTSSTTETLPLYENSVSRSFGQIDSITLETVPVEALQAAWETGISQCTARSFGGIHPTRNQCIDGATITYPSGTKFCTFFGASVPCGVKTSTIKIPGAPPYPEQGASGQFDAGAELTLASNTSVGVEFSAIDEPGVVDVSYAANVTVETRSTEDPEVFQIVATGGINEALTSIESDYRQQQSLTATFIAQSTTSLELTTCVPPDPCQTQSESMGLDGSFGVGPLRQEVLELTLDSSATGLPSAFPDVSVQLFDSASYEFGYQDLALDGLGDAFESEVTWPLPGGTPVQGLPRFGVGLPIGDFGIYNADYDMTNDFACGADLGLGCLDRAFVDDNGVYHRTRDPLPRTSIQGPGQTQSIVLPTDYLRLDADLDFILSGGVGFGLSVGVPGVATALVDLADLDLATFWGKSQDFSFVPTTSVTYEFNEPTLVQIDGEFQLVSSYTAALGEAVNVRSPSPTLVATPVYSVAENTFHNLTQNYIDFAIDERVLGASLNGLLFAALGIDNDWAALAASIGFGNVKTATLIDDAFALGGFNDFRGTSIDFSTLFAEGGEGGSGTQPPVGVPEPATLSLIACALLVLGGMRRRVAA